MDHVNNAVYLDWLEESIVGAAAPAAARTATTDVPRRYRMEFTLAVEAGAELEDAVWPDETGWAYRLGGAGEGADRFRARITAGAAAEDVATNPQGGR